MFCPGFIRQIDISRGKIFPCESSIMLNGFGVVTVSRARLGDPSV